MPATYFKSYTDTVSDFSFESFDWSGKDDTDTVGDVPFDWGIEDLIPGRTRSNLKTILYTV